MTPPEHLAIIEQGARENGHLLNPCYLRIALVHMQRLAEEIEPKDVFVPPDPDRHL